MEIKLLIFDWGDTIMVDFDLPGPMSEWERVDWVTGAEEALRELSKSYRCVIATSAPHSNSLEMVKALARVGAEQYFGEFYSANDMGVRKPDPLFFETILAREGFKPTEAVSIGNIYEKDILGAKEAGLFTVLLNTTDDSGPFPSADVVITSMEGLTGAMESLK
jgi:putative hydrolase of the HAD superfamily